MFVLGKVRSGHSFSSKMWVGSYKFDPRPVSAIYLTILESGFLLLHFKFS